MRPASSSFAPRAEVFPGGSVDAADLDSGWTNMAPELAAKSPVATHLLVTAVRETFEECGVLLVRDEYGEPCAPELAARLQSLRQQVPEGHPDAFRAGLRGQGLRPAWEDLCFCAHWVTPDGLPRIFDTRFFLALLPAGQQPSIDEGQELESLRWIAPGTALEEALRGDALLLPPTRAVLGSLARH
ncbi:MAG: NUDIX hydrolase, partial [Candidatus Dormiibacterota bacterium]